MGDPRRLRKKYQGPRHPWQASRLKTEASLVREFGLKNKREIYKAVSEAKRLSNHAKRLIRSINPAQAERETQQFLSRLQNYGLLSPESVLGDVLSLTGRDILSRRLQSIVCKKGFALTPKQARQFIVHGHIAVNDRRITIPSYSVSLAEEDTVHISEHSQFADPDHPERAKERKAQEEIAKEKKGVKKDLDTPSEVPVGGAV